MKLSPHIHLFPWQSFTENNCNTYLIDIQAGGTGRILIDPGYDQFFGHVRQSLDQLGIGLHGIETVLLTHGHPDHSEAAGRFQNKNTRLAMHETEWNFIKNNGTILAGLFGCDLEKNEPDTLLKEGTFLFHGRSFEVFHTPGHTPGSICLYWPDEKVLFTGDLIFKEGIGRVDFPGGNGHLIKESIRRISSLDVELLLPGHGEPLTGRAEVKENFNDIINFYFDFIE